MPFQFVRNDITNMQVDAIVNTTNPTAEIGYGVDYAIHQKAGFRLLAARRLLGTIHPGQAKITKGYKLPAKHVIHTVCPMWVDGTQGEPQLLATCYENALKVAHRNKCRSIAFPLIAAGNLGFPKSIAMQIAISTINSFLMDHDMDVSLVVFSSDTLALSERLFTEVKSYIDENYVRETVLREYDLPKHTAISLDELQEKEYLLMREARRDTYWQSEADSCFEEECTYESAVPKSAMPLPSTSSSLDDLKQILQNTDASFADTLMELIKRKKMTNPEVYTRALVDRRTFSKIFTIPNYTPAKRTILALAVALELDLADTKMLLERAEYALTHASKFDIIVEFFIKKKHYDIFLINDVLYEFDQPLLGSK